MVVVTLLVHRRLGQLRGWCEECFQLGALACLDVADSRLVVSASGGRYSVNLLLADSWRPRVNVSASGG
jgi:hypothetical protein